MQGNPAPPETTSTIHRDNPQEKTPNIPSAMFEGQFAPSVHRCRVCLCLLKRVFRSPAVVSSVGQYK